MRAVRVALLLLGVAAVAAVLALVANGGGHVVHPAAAPLASPAATPGQVGGLLPDVALTGRIRATRARTLRPAVILLVRAGCGCLDAVRQVVAAASDRRLLTYLVESGRDLTQVLTLAAGAGVGDIGPYADPAGAFATAYRLHSSAALVLVRADGVVTQVVDAVGPGLSLDAALRTLVP